MDLKYEFEDSDYESLYQAIMKAISKSPEVRSLATSLASQDPTEDMATINLILCIDELAKLTGKSQKETCSTNNIDTWSTSKEFEELGWLKQARIKL